VLNSKSKKEKIATITRTHVISNKMDIVAKKVKKGS
jgi:hypothetical protein